MSEVGQHWHPENDAGPRLVEIVWYLGVTDPNNVDYPVATVPLWQEGTCTPCSTCGSAYAYLLYFDDYKMDTTLCRACIDDSIEYLYNGEFVEDYPEKA